MPCALVADEFILGKTINAVAVAMICNVLIGTVVLGLKRSMFQGNTVNIWRKMAKNDPSGIIGQEQELNAS